MYFAMSLVLKVSAFPEGKTDGITKTSVAGHEARLERVSTFTLLSFQRPRRLPTGKEKASDTTMEAPERVVLPNLKSLSGTLRFVGGLYSARLKSSRTIVAAA